MYLRKEQKTKFYRLLGDRIEAKRQKTSQEEIARRVGISRTTLINIENGRQSVPVHILLVFARVFQCKLEDLLPVSEEYEKVDMQYVGSSELPPEAAEVVNRVINKAKL